MVKLSTVRIVKSATEDEVAHLSSPTNKIPNRFRVSTDFCFFMAADIYCICAFLCHDRANTMIVRSLAVMTALKLSSGARATNAAKPLW